MPGPDAYRPGDIITTRDGKTIEVLNTDAEGRIILADAIAHARLTYKPSAILEYSTLTGAVIMALGHQPRRAVHRGGKTARGASSPPAKPPANSSGPCRSTTNTRKTSSPKSPRRKTPSLREGSACSSASFVKTLGRGNALRPFRHRRHRLDDQAARLSRRRRDRLRRASDAEGVEKWVAGLTLGLCMFSNPF